MPAPESADTDRRLHAMLRVGIVHAVDHTAPGPRVRVADGDLVTDWLHVLTPRAGADRVYLAPTVGEQVLIAAPGGITESAVVLGSLPSEEHPAPGSAAGVHRVMYADGCQLEYDRNAHRLSAILPDGGSVRLSAPGGTVTIEGAVHIRGHLTVEDDATVAGRSFLGHIHGGTTPGSGTTGAPV